MNAGFPVGEAAKRPAGYRPSRLFVAVLALVMAGVIGWLAPAILSPSATPRTPVARVEVANAFTALKAFQTHFASYPTGNLAQVSASLRGSNRQGLIFLNVPGRSLNDAGELVDAWKHPLRIILTNPAGPIVYSLGPNGRDDGGVPGTDDLVSP
jgi:hypothetical protein